MKRNVTFFSLKEILCFLHLKGKFLAPKVICHLEAAYSFNIIYQTVHIHDFGLGSKKFAITGSHPDI